MLPIDPAVVAHLRRRPRSGPLPPPRRLHLRVRLVPLTLRLPVPTLGRTP
jgi:hypothetical protein